MARDASYINFKALVIRQLTENQARAGEDVSKTVC